MSEFYQFASNNPILTVILTLLIVLGVDGIFDAIARSFNGGCNCNCDEDEEE
jgi:hypothetical protein